MAEDIEKADDPVVTPQDDLKDDPKDDVKDTPNDSPDADETEELRKEIKKLRKENAKRRTDGNEVEEQLKSLKDSIAKSLGLKEDDNPDPTELSSELAQLKDKYRQERLKNSFYRVAQKYEADTDLTWAMLYASGQIAEIDVEGEEFEEELDKLVKATVAKNPKLKNSYRPNTDANPPKDEKKTIRDEYNEVKAQVQKDQNNHALKQRLFLLKSQLKE